MNNTITATQIEQLVTLKTKRIFGVKPEDATEKQIYKALCLVVRDILTEKRVIYKKARQSQGAKQVYYMSAFRLRPPV